jgi:hypothetical protein
LNENNQKNNEQKSKELKLIEIIIKEQEEAQEHAFSPILIPLGDEREKLALGGQEKFEELREIYLNKILKRS